jgi:hypothetical protein
MKKMPADFSKARRKHLRSNIHHLRRRLKWRATSLWFTIRGRKATHPHAELRKKPRFREEHITIAMLRFRLAHADAVMGKGGYATYSEAFKDFILNCYEEAREKFTRRQFARAAEIPVSTLRQWLAQSRRPLQTALEARAIPEPVVVRSPGMMWQFAALVANGATSLGLAAKNFGSWVVEQLKPDPYLAIVGNGGYGGVEIKRNYQKYEVWGLLIAVILNFAGIGIYQMTLTEGETMRTVTLMKYVELPNLNVEEPIETKEVSGGGGGGVEPSAGVAGNDVMAVPDQFVPMADFIAIPNEVAELALLGRPSFHTNGTPLGKLVASSNPLALPTLNMGSVGPTTPHATDFQNPAGIGVPSSSGAYGQSYTPGLQAARIGYSGPGGAGTGYSPYSSGRERAPAPVSQSKPTKKFTNPPEKVEVKEKDLSGIELDKVFQELVGWLLAHQSELSETVKKCLRHKQGDITATVSITVGATPYDLFFLCNDKSQDIGILLVEHGESANATLLRDTGFRKKSFYLSKGVATRDEDNSVVSTSMLETGPSEAETSRFYDIFLSWWEENKP